MMITLYKRWTVSCPEVSGNRYMSRNEFLHFIKYGLLSKEQVKENHITIQGEFQYCDFCSELDWHRENWK